MKNHTRTTLVGLLVGSLAAVAIAAGPGPAHAEPRPEPIRVAIVGDSITTLANPDNWPHHVLGEGVSYAGGWAQAGATSTLMAESVVPTEADVLVVMAGTNDFHTGVSIEQNIADLDRIVATIRAPRVIVLKLPPIDYIALDGQTVVEERNAALEAAAAPRGWEFIDPWASLRAEGGVWAPGVSADGIHPLLAGSQTAAAVIRAAIVRK